MASSSGKLFVVERDEALRAIILNVLSTAGYEVSTDYSEGMKAVLGFGPDVVIIGADPPQLDCCDLLSEIKSSESTRNIQVLMLSPGGAPERTRGLDLGADDVLSVPFDPHELLARVRSQLKNRQLTQDLQQRLRVTEDNREAAQQVVTAVDRERSTLKVVGGVAAALVLVAGVSLLFFYRRTQEQNTRVYAVLTRLQSGVLTEQQLIERSRRALEGAQNRPANNGNPERLRLQKQSEQLKSKLASGNAENVSVLQEQLHAVEGRLQSLENDGIVAQTIIRSYEPSVCLIHVVLGFRDRRSGLSLRYAGLTSAGEPLTDEHENPLLSITGNGPEVHLDVFGTGFLASSGGEILTNHHVVEPWWQNDDLKEMLDQGLEPIIGEMTAYFPGVSHGIAIATQDISSSADVAVVKADVSELRIKQIALAGGQHLAVSGAAVVLLGYPTALDAILARTGEETLQSIAATSKGDPKQVMEELARRNLIRPISTQGHIGGVLPDKIIYDAQTSSGGSGGPLFSHEGKVIGINFAMVREFGGSNFAIPVSYGKALLKH